MDFITVQKGCYNSSTCLGPQTDRVLLFGSELQFLTLHGVAAIACGILLFLILATMTRMKKVYSVLISLLATLAFFCTFALLFPVRILY